MAMLFWTILAMHFFFEIAWRAKYAFTDVFGSRAICHCFSSQLISWIVDTWEEMQILSSCIIDSEIGTSMCGERSSRIGCKFWILVEGLEDLLWMTGWEKLTLSGLCELYSQPRGMFAFHFCDPNTSSPSRCGSLLKNLSTLGMVKIASVSTFGFLVLFVERWATQSNNSSFLGPVPPWLPLRYW